VDKEWSGEERPNKAAASMDRLGVRDKETSVETLRRRKKKHRVGAIHERTKQRFPTDEKRLYLRTPQRHKEEYKFYSQAYRNRREWQISGEKREKKPNKGKKKKPPIQGLQRKVPKKKKQWTQGPRKKKVPEEEELSTTESDESV
jgi:hypothetical protein